MMRPEELAQGIEAYLASLQAQGAMAESLYRAGDKTMAESILIEMQRRMGIY